MSERRPPDVVFVGLYKAGTSLLRAYFTQHPEIEWTRNAQYFLSDWSGDNKHAYPDSIEISTDTKCYVDMFEGVAIGYIFRGNPDWTAVGFVPGSPIDGRIVIPDPVAVARRIRLTIPNVRILLILRNQIDWLRSNYLHHLSFLPARHRNFADFLTSLEGKSAAFAGLFHQTIAGYYEQVGRENVHVMLLEALEKDEEATLRSLCSFLRVDYAPFNRADGDLNEGKGVTAGRVISLLSRLGFSDRQIGNLSRAMWPLKPMARSLSGGDVISRKERMVLESMYAASNFHAGRLTGLDLKHFGYPM